MTNVRKILSVFITVALLEGFSGLGIEIYVMRLASGYIGSSTSITGIIIAIMLIGIALGYWLGGKISNCVPGNKVIFSVAWVLGISAVLQSVASCLQIFIIKLALSSTFHPFYIAAILSFVFAVGMVFATASIPLMTQLLVNITHNAAKAGKFTGLLVATTTFGSVLGSILTPIFLLPTIGLQSTIIFFIGILLGSCLVIFICFGLGVDDVTHRFNRLFIISLIIMVGLLNWIDINYRFDYSHQTKVTGWYILKGHDLIGDEVKIFTDSPMKLYSSCWKPKKEIICDNFYPNQFVNAMIEKKPKEVLMLGGAGFSIPSDKRVITENPNVKVTVVDLDAKLPTLVSKYYLEKSIGTHISFKSTDSRSYIMQYRGKPYDMTLIDVFRGKFVDGPTFTLENLNLLKTMSKLVMANVIGLSHKNDSYTQTIASTWVSAFGEDNAYWLFENTNSNSFQGIVMCNYPCKGSHKIITSPFFAKTKEVNTLDKILTDNPLYQENL